MIFKDLFILLSVLNGCSSTKVFRVPNAQIINNLSDLQNAIVNANQDSLTTIEITSFSISNASFKDAMRNLNINGKSIVIKGASENTTITSLDQGSFYIIGNNDKTSNLTFENITFTQEISEEKTIRTPNCAVALSKNSCNTNLTFKDCIFKNLHSPKNTGGAIQVAYSNAEDYKVNLSIENCSFINCNSSFGGGAISIDGNNNANLNIKNSTFDGNSSPKGGAILSSGAKFNIENCEFSNNSSENGGVFNISNSASFITRNDFKNNISNSVDGNSIKIENSRLNSNTFINNSFYNEKSDKKEFFIDPGKGSLPEIKSNIYFNTFVSTLNNDNSHNAYAERINELGNLYISNIFDKNLLKDKTCGYSSNKDLITVVEEKYFLANSSELLLNKAEYEQSLKSFYLNIYGDFYIGNNLSNKIKILYDNNVKTYSYDEKINLDAEKFGFDFIKFTANDNVFDVNKCLISSNSPLAIKANHKINSTGVVTFIVGPILLLIVGCLIFIFIKLFKRKKSNVSSFDINNWSDSSINSEICNVLTDKEKMVLKHLLKGSPRKEIAADLYMSESTVKNHVTKIYSKLHVKNKSELFQLFNH